MDRRKVGRTRASGPAALEAAAVAAARATDNLCVSLPDNKRY